MSVDIFRVMESRCDQSWNSTNFTNQWAEIQWTIKKPSWISIIHYFSKLAETQILAILHVQTQEPNPTLHSRWRKALHHGILTGIRSDGSRGVPLGGGGHCLFEGSYPLPNYRPIFQGCLSMSFIWPPPIFGSSRSSPSKSILSQCKSYTKVTQIFP